jgi:hypothetical protein
MNLFLFQQHKASRVLVNKGLFRIDLKIWLFSIRNKYVTFLGFPQVPSSVNLIFYIPEKMNIPLP